MLTWRDISLRTRILVLVTALASLTVCGGIISLWYNYRMNAFFQEVLEKNLIALHAADSLERTLVMQKGYLTYFFQDHDPKWLVELEANQKLFQGWLDQVATSAQTIQDNDIINLIRENYAHLDELRQEVIQLYQAGDTEKGFELHQTVRANFFEIHKLAKQYRQKHEQAIEQARHEVSRRAAYLTNFTLAAVPISALLSVLLGYVLWRQVLAPIRSLAEEASLTDHRSRRFNEVQALRRGVHNLMEDVDQTRSELEASRRRLIQSAKMASVGKLAASVAHSIRNPLTALKMRIFSLERNLVLTDTEQEDFKVIGDEIRHIDNVLRNFLEYSRRPKLNMARLPASRVVDMALELMRPRIESYGIRLVHHRPDTLPEIDCDPDQLKETLVNLLVNATEAVGRDALITVEESFEEDGPLGPAVVIGISDNGPGIPVALHDQVFQIFFSTKDQGTGLGLSIAARIIEEHGGTLELDSSTACGATFIIRLPS
jgi:signal transduction histidine kinase